MKLETLLEKNIPFVLFRAPGKTIRLIAQKSPLDLLPNFQQSGFHFAPFSGREEVPYLVIKNDLDITFPKNSALSKLDSESIFENFPTLSSTKNFYKEKAVSSAEYLNDIKIYLDFFEENNTRKAIYSRIKNTTLPIDFSLNAFFEKIEKAYSRAMVYLANLPGIGLWAGASPEILLKYNNGIAETVALAGTQRIVEGKNYRDLEWGKKEIEEHQMVANYITKKILSNGLTLVDQSETYTSQAGAVAHLKQRFRFEISRNQLSMFIKNLRPTPAVCGLPKEKALNLIYQTEPYNRQYYCGYLGMVEADDSVDFYVNLRCMKIYKTHASLFVGGGITKDSIPEKEWEETELKAKTMLNILDLIEV